MFDLRTRYTRPPWVARACVALLLTAALFASAALVAPPSAPASEFAVALVFAGVSSAHATSPETPPGTAPIAVPPGSQFKAWYRVSNPYDFPVRVQINAEISSFGRKIQDGAGVVSAMCSLPPQSASMCTRLFTVPGDTATGLYMVHLGISITPGSTIFLGSAAYEGTWLLVRPEAATIAPPTPTPPGPAATPPPLLPVSEPNPTATAAPEPEPEPEPDPDPQPEEPTEEQ